MNNEPVHEISNNVVCATSKASDQPAHTRSLIRAFASRLSILLIVKLLTEHYLVFLSLIGGCRGSSESTPVKMSNCWKSQAAAQLNDEGIDNSDRVVNLERLFQYLNSIEPTKISRAKSFIEQLKSIQIPGSCVLELDFSLNEISAACQELKKKQR